MAYIQDGDTGDEDDNSFVTMIVVAIIGVKILVLFPISDMNMFQNTY